LEDFESTRGRRISGVKIHYKKMVLYATLVFKGELTLISELGNA
jgi:hypothetical protein